MEIYDCFSYCSGGNDVATIDKELFNYEDSGGLMNIQAKRVGSIVEDVMNGKEFGMVHSVFNSSFNLIFGSKLVHIGSIENGLAPFGVGVEEDSAHVLTKRVRQGERVSWDQENKRLVFQNGFVLVIRFAPIQKAYLSEYRCDMDYLQNTIHYVSKQIILKQWKSGLIDTIEEQRAIFAERQLIEAAGLISKLPTLMTEIRSLESIIENPITKDSKAVFDYWLGRGPGLTPSGDDIITGICASLHVLGNNRNSFISELGQYLQQYGKKRTTAVAYEYLEYAVHGLYHSTIVTFCEAIVRGEQKDLDKALIEMEKIGHTSGADTLFGMMIGFKVFM